MVTFTLSPNVHTHGSSLKLYKPLTHLQCTSNYFSTTIINLWNQLPDEIVRSNTLNCFKSEIDNYFNDVKYIFL